MNRPLEFRAWHEPSKTMFYGVSFDESTIYVPGRYENNNTVYYHYNFLGPLKREDCILMQCTGVLDPTGAKVWEGDVLRFDIDMMERGDPTQYSAYYVVDFYNGCFCMIQVETIGQDYSELFDPFIFLEGCQDIKVGNRYEHPNFMELTGQQPLATNHLVES